MVSEVTSIVKSISYNEVNESKGRDRFPCLSTFPSFPILFFFRFKSLKSHSTAGIGTISILAFHLVTFATLFIFNYFNPKS